MDAVMALWAEANNIGCAVCPPVAAKHQMVVVGASLHPAFAGATLGAIALIHHSADGPIVPIAFLPAASSIPRARACARHPRREVPRPYGA